MGLWGSVAGGVLGLGASIFGGIKASQAAKKVKADIQRQRQENDDWYNRRYNEDYTQRADAQRILTQTQEAIRQRNRQAAGAAAVMGGTEESAAATKAANAAALAEATSQIAVQGERSKDEIERQYRSRQSELDKQLNEMEAARAQAISQAVQGVGEAAGSITNLF